MKKLLYILPFILLGCISEKKATEKVLNSPKAKEKVGRAWEKENPCVRDTSIVIKTDTLVDVIETQGETKYDTLRTKDTVFIAKTVQVVKTQTNTIYKDRFITDKRRENLLKADLQIANSKIEKLKQTVKDKEAETDAMRGKRNWWIAKFFFLLVICIGSHWIRSKVKL